ncbi:Gfo/Idh/MocA family protein [Arthrobacter agilis]|uniref:Gfo/Idh/MocA family protein n=1 Tax=Arthrobacter agilis TaxID=37921 RepID=UPI00277F4977|nr:Gfo/Idh/MocA family oxidoreductase [Arthrobacter agilis]MDQ0736865.1 putative dehydrogenase [Arthrobacter agilis]
MSSTTMAAEQSELFPDVEIRCRDYRIGCIGAGMIMADVHLEAYRQAGFPVVAIASRTEAKARAVAEQYGIATVHATPEDLIDDGSVQVLDIAYPPDLQPALIRRALEAPHIRAILAQKPLALELGEAIALRDEAAAAGKILSVNQNMRYDQSIRVLRQLLDRGDLGAPVLATIEMRAIPHWQGFLEGYDRLTLANMSVHHLDALRFLFGEPTEIMTVAREDPRTAFDHEDGIVVSTLRFPHNVLAVSMEDVWSGPREEASTQTSTSNGGSRGRVASPRAPSAGRQGSPRRSPTRPP